MLDTTQFYDTSDSVPDVLPGAPFDAWRLRVLSPAEVLALPARERLAYFSAWALLAPTSHNTVPQRFRLKPAENALEFWIDRNAVLPESDPDARQATVSLGCALESAVLAASAYGFTSQVELDGKARPLPSSESSPNPVLIATARFKPPLSRGYGGEPGEPGERGAMLAALKGRKMVRAVFDEQVKLSPAVAAELDEQVRSLHPGLTLHLLTDAPTKIFLGKFQELADTTVINRPRFARELGAWLLPNEATSLVGMRGHEFGLSGGAATRMHLGLLGQGPLLPDETAGFAKVSNVGMRTASAIAVLTVAKDDVEHRVAAGRAFQRLATALVKAGFATAMHAGITEVDGPNLALRGRLRTSERPTVVFRIGKPIHAEDGARPHSSRPPLRDLLLPEVD